MVWPLGLLRPQPARHLLLNEQLDEIVFHDRGPTREWTVRKRPRCIGRSSRRAIETPMILERSGIGRADVLARAGVDLRAVSPHVGERV